MSSPKPIGVTGDRCYAIERSQNGKRTDITMYGEIVEKRPKMWGEPVEGDFIVKSEFLDDINNLNGCSELFIRMDSVGGEAWTAITISNRLREIRSEHKTKITVQIDGVAMSAAISILCAADVVITHPNNIFMIHQAAVCMCGYYNAEELKSYDSMLRATDESQIGAMKRKCGAKCDEDTIREKLNATTYMTGEEAFDMGLADIVDDVDDVQIVASANRRIVYENGRQIFLPYGLAIPENFDIQVMSGSEPVKTNKPTPESTGNNGGGKSTMAKTLTELKQECPELLKEYEAEVQAKSDTQSITDSAVKEAIDSERARIQGIEEIEAAIGDSDLIQKAKFGEKPMTAEQLSLAAMKAQAGIGATVIENLGDDTKNSGASEVKPTSDGTVDKTEDQKAEELLLSHIPNQKEGK